MTRRIPTPAIWPAAFGRAARVHDRRAGAAGALSEPADHHRRAVSSRRTDRCAGPLAAAMLQEKLGQGVVIENKTGGSGMVGAAYAARATPDGYTLFANSLADTQNLHYLPVTYNPVDDFAQIGWIVDGPPLVLIIDAKLPYKTLGEVARRRQGQSQQVQLRHVRPGLVAGTDAGAAQQGRAGPDPGGALSRLGRCGSRPLPAARSRARSRSTRRPSRWPMTARCAPLAVAARSGSTAGPTCRPSPSRATRSISAALSGLPRRPRHRSRSSISSASTQRGGAERRVQEAHGGARHGAAAGRRQHAGEVRPIHARRDRAAGRTAELSGQKLTAERHAK